MFFNIINYIDKNESIIYKLQMKSGPISLIKKIIDICRYRRKKENSNKKLSHFLKKEEINLINFYLKNIEYIKYQDEEELNYEDINEYYEYSI